MHLRGFFLLKKEGYVSWENNWTFLRIFGQKYKCIFQIIYNRKFCKFLNTLTTWIEQAQNHVKNDQMQMLVHTNDIQISFNLDTIF